MQQVQWLERWTAGNTGWHQPTGSDTLKIFWPAMDAGTRVLVPLCGKSVDMFWLAGQGLDVTGVELSPVAIEGFFSDHNLDYECTTVGPHKCYRATTAPIVLYCGDYFEFSAPPFDALYDRAALIALGPELRPSYAQHTSSLLNNDAFHLLDTLEYQQSQVAGPPYCVRPEEVLSYWPRLRPVCELEAIDSCPPKFRDAGVTHVNEVVWVSTPP